MARRGSRRPTKAELEILWVLWARGPSTVREVHEALPHGRGTTYTTTLKLLQIMLEKDLVARDESRRSHVYSARLKQRSAEKQLLAELTDTVFEGSVQKLVMRALGSRKMSPEEAREIRDLLDELEARE
ncbi:MAG: transcriptional regulator [Planctomycetes bacterium DG_58]|nr:MAG: transcriptional regulator [Planctomycetes bacterium DG_58]